MTIFVYHSLDLERVIGPSVIKVVAQATDDQSQALELTENLPPLSFLEFQYYNTFSVQTSYENANIFNGSLKRGND